METIGSQTRESLKEASYVLEKIRENGEVILFNKVDGCFELWVANDSYAGYVVEIDGIGYEFCRTVNHCHQ